AFGAIGAGDSPDVLGVSRKLLLQVDAELAMRARRGDRVTPPVGVRLAAFATVAEIGPGERILVRPQHRLADVLIVAVAVRVAFPRVPCFGRQRPARGAYAQQVHQGELAILFVAVNDKAALRTPAVRHQVWMTIANPVVIDAAINLHREPRDLGVLTEVLARCERSGVEPGAVADRHLAVTTALARLHVDEVIEPAVLVLCAIRVELQRCARPLTRLFPREPLALGADAQRGEAESRGAGAADVSPRLRKPSVESRPVAGNAGGRVGLLPAELTRTVPPALQQHLILARQ